MAHHHQPSDQPTPAPLPAEAVAATLAALAPAGPAALRASSRADGAPLVVAALHACVVGAGFQPVGFLPAGWHGGPDAVEWVFDYTCPGKAHAFQLHASLQAATGRLLVHFRELLPPRPPGAGAVLAMAAVGAADGPSGRGCGAGALPGVGASAFLGASVSRYLAGEEDGAAAPAPSTDPAAAWAGATTNLGALAAMVAEHLTGPVSAAAEPGVRGEAGASPPTPAPSAWWTCSTTTLALGVAVLAVGVGVAAALKKGGGGGRWPAWRRA